MSGRAVPTLSEAAACMCFLLNPGCFQEGLLSHRYWRFNEESHAVDPGYPRKIGVWAGVPPAPKGVFLSPDASKWETGRTKVQVLHKAHKKAFEEEIAENYDSEARDQGEGSSLPLRRALKSAVLT